MSLVLVKSLETVAKKAEGESAGWTVKLIIFVGGTCGSVQCTGHGLVLIFRTMHGTRSCAHISHKDRVRKATVAVKRALWKKLFKDWIDLNKTW